MISREEACLDILREAATIGADNGATALSELANKRVDVDVPNVYHARLDEVQAIIGRSEVVVGIRLIFDGERPGSFFLLIKEEDALSLLTMVLGRKVERADEFAISAILEIGNILVGVFLTALTKFLGGTLRQSPPIMKVDMIGAMIEETLAEYGRITDKIWLADIRFMIEGKALGGRLLFIPFFDIMRELLGR